MLSPEQMDNSEVENLPSFEKASTVVTITNIRSYRSPRKKMLLITAIGEDETGKVGII